MQTAEKGGWGIVQPFYCGDKPSEQCGSCNHLIILTSTRELIMFVKADQPT
jgi:hypothetical protein